MWTEQLQQPQTRHSARDRTPGYSTKPPHHQLCTIIVMSGADIGPFRGLLRPAKGSTALVDTARARRTSWEAIHLLLCKAHALSPLRSAERACLHDPAGILFQGSAGYNPVGVALSNDAPRQKENNCTVSELDLHRCKCMSSIALDEGEKLISGKL